MISTAILVCNPSTREAEEEGSDVEDQPQVYSKFKASLD